MITTRLQLASRIQLLLFRELGEKIAIDNVYVSDFNTNIAQVELSGLDLKVNYRFEPFSNAGTFNVNFTGNYLHRLNFVPSLGADPENELDSATYPAPKYSATFDLGWTNGPLSINYGVNWWTKTRRVTREQQALLAIGGEAHVIDVQRQGLAAADGFLAEALDVERHLLLALGD